MTNPSKDMLTILVCPISKSPLIYNDTSQELISKKAGLAFPVRDGIPILLVDEARALTPEEVAGLSKD